MMRREIMLMKEAGFNLIRTHLRPSPPGYLDLTDEVGMLVYAENSLGWIKSGPRLFDHGRREAQAVIERDSNHPSVVLWGLLNENRPANAIMGEELLRWARALDPTRVLLDNSGGSLCVDQDFGWIDRTTVVSSGETERQVVHDLHVYVGAPVSPAVYEWMRTLGVKDARVDIVAQGFASTSILDDYYRSLASYSGQIFLSEIGCGGMADLDETVAGFGDQQHLLDASELRAFRDDLHQGFKERGLDKVFGSVKNLYRQAQEQHALGNARQKEALLVNHRVSGYVLTQLNDVAWEFHGGLLDLWRKPKLAYYSAQRVQQPLVVVLKAETPVVACGARVEVALSLVDRGALQGDERVQVTLAGPAGEERTVYDAAAPAGAGIKELGIVAVTTLAPSGERSVTACVTRGEVTVAESSETILALSPVDWSDLPDGIAWLGQPPDWRPKHAEAASETENRRLKLAARPATLTRGDWQTLIAAVQAGHRAILVPCQGSFSLWPEPQKPEKQGTLGQPPLVI